MKDFSHPIAWMHVDSSTAAGAGGGVGRGGLPTGRTVV